MTERIVTDSNGRKYITTEPFKPDYNTEAVLVEEMQRMAKRIADLEALLERQTARIVELQTHIENGRRNDWRKIADAIEAKLKEKNT